MAKRKPPPRDSTPSTPRKRDSAATRSTVAKQRAIQRRADAKPSAGKPKQKAVLYLSERADAEETHRHVETGDV